MSSLTAEQSNRLKRLAAMGSVSLAVTLTVIKTICLCRRFGYFRHV